MALFLGIESIIMSSSDIIAPDCSIYATHTMGKLSSFHIPFMLDMSAIFGISSNIPPLFSLINLIS